eukprot:scaffold76270_cov45-Phaeocystis_antarctica.AAC.5
MGVHATTVGTALVAVAVSCSWRPPETQNVAVGGGGWTAMRMALAAPQAPCERTSRALFL